MELGTYRLAEINKGGGLRQKAVGLATQYLNGVGNWVDMPTSMTPTAHTHNYAGSDSAGGPATTATKLATTRALTIGNTAKNFDGSAAVSWTLAEIGANQWKNGVGSGAIMTNSATAAGLRSGDVVKPYVFFTGIVGESFKSGGLAGTDQSWAVIPPNTNYTYAYGGGEYTYNNSTANYVFLLLIDSSDFIGSATAPFNRCRIIANADTNYLSSYRTILTVGTPITGNVYPVIVSTGSSTAPSGINYTESVSLYAALKSSDAFNYTGSYSVASGYSSVASGNSSVASGFASVASGNSSVASGLYSVASGNSSVASGYSSVAAGNYSVASGLYSVASGASQTVIGKYNVADTSSSFIIGNGTSTSARSNCMTVDFSGNMSLAGSIAIGANKDLTIPKHAGLNRLAYFDSSGVITSSASYTLSDFAPAGHNHSIPDLYCGVPYIVPGRILISGSGASSNPTWLDAGTNGKILGWTSGAPAWVDAPSGSTVSPANPTASVGLTAVNGSAATFMRSDAAPKLDVTIAPTWTGNHTFSGLTQLANVGIGVSPSTSYKLYVVEDKEITTAGSYIGNYLIAKYNTDLSSGTRQGIALLGQLWATGGTLTHAKGLDFKVYVPSGTVTEATAINAVIQTDGGSIGTAYALKLSRSGAAPTVKNYGIYQEDSAATNVFNGYCEFNGGTNLVTSGRARNIRFMTESDDIDHTSGTDTLIIVTSSSDAVLTLPTSATTGDRIEFYSTLATASFACASAKIWPINNSSGKVTAWGGGMGAPAYCFAIWDGTYWRVGYLSPGY